MKLVAVSQRRSEIGLLKARGAPPRRILTHFLTDSALAACTVARTSVRMPRARPSSARFAWALSAMVPASPPTSSAPASTPSAERRLLCRRTSTWRRCVT